MITHKPIDPSNLEAELNDPACGGVVAFVGKVRNHHDGKKVTGLTYEAYVPMAEKILTAIAAEAVEKFGVKEAKILHRVGDLEIGDIAVWVGVESAHRAEAFEACRYVIDELKQRTPIWKKEHYQDGKRQWVGCKDQGPGTRDQGLKALGHGSRVTGHGSKHKYIAVILAGGQSKRFGNDKLFALFKGRTLVEILLSTLKSCGFDVVISGPKNKFGHLGVPIIGDEHPFDGPLSALSSVWKKTTADRILVVAGDMPFISSSVIGELWEKNRMADVTLLCGASGPSPLPGVYSRETQKTIIQLLKEGRRDLFSLLDRGFLVEIIDKNKFAPGNEGEQALVNINTANDLDCLT
ncbi:MAG: molybdenum cofactor biosynthesis protein MoaE [Deltaproteobacteria bacterium]|nr:molybdenum cofactor biosynthesis protein MoaE [Deltaproteobacteria bacterium]